MSNELPPAEPPVSRESAFRALSRQPRVVLFLLIGWTVLSALPQLFVNSGLFLDIHDAELDGALGGFAFTLNAVPLAAVYVFALTNPRRHGNVFWLGFIHQTVATVAVLYQWILGTFSPESIVVPAVGSGVLAAMCFLQAMEAKPEEKEE